MRIGRRQLLRWHVWLGWLVGVPLVLWTVTGLVMVARPIEVVRGTDLRVERPTQALPRGVAPALPFLGAGGAEVADYRIAMRDGRAIARVTYLDGSEAVFDGSSGTRLTPIGETEARRIARENIRGARIVAAKPFEASAPPFDFRQPKAVWQVRLAAGTNVYVGRDSGEIEAVRTRFWRVFDFMWGLHIMDLQTRENTHHPILILFAALAGLGSILGCVLMIRRYSRPRKTSV